MVNYNNYLDKLFCNKTIYNNLQNTEKILLLSMLTKKRHKQLTVNQIQYVTELMEYYYKAFLYLNAIKQAENLLENEIIDNLRLNKECHKFWVVYFNSLLAIANYKKIIEYKNCFEDDDLNYDVAVALYNSGYPYEALEQLEKRRNDISKYDGYSHLLKASIYDWLGNNKKSKNEFKKALLNGDDKIKYQIFKRYNMYIDFRIPECRYKMKQAIGYYKENNLKQYAECLHNYGTGCIFIKDYKSAQKYLNLSLDILNKICADQIYYPLNSLAILYCYNKCDYKKATNIIREALKCNINETFCKLALHNNLFNIAINMRDLELAYKEKNSLENIINNECNNNTNNDRSDIKHQIRQFYYNYALLFKSQNNITKALEYFKKADKCSNYESNVVYSIKRNIFELKKKKTGTLADNDWPRITDGMAILSGAKIHIDDTPGIKISELRSKCRKLKIEKGLDLVLIDYLQLMEGEGQNESRQQEIAKISRSLKILAKELDCPVVALSQLSRAPEQRADHRPMLSDLRESGSIEQDADIVMFLYRDEYYNPDTEKKNIGEVIVAKNRHGETGTVELVWFGGIQKFADKMIEQ